MTLAQTFYFVREDQPGQEYNFLLQSSREQGRNLKRANLDLQKYLEKLPRKFTNQLQRSILANGRGKLKTCRGNAKKDQPWISAGPHSRRPSACGSLRRFGGRKHMRPILRVQLQGPVRAAAGCNCQIRMQDKDAE